MLALNGEMCQRRKGYKGCVCRLQENLLYLIVGKFEKSHCDYRSSKITWVTGGLFWEWLVSLERKRVCQNTNVFLIMDQCSHYDEGDIQKHVCLSYLPPSTTSYMDPLYQGIISCMKHKY
jgi:hypothetical protein